MSALESSRFPVYYWATVRSLVRWSVVMIVVGLLVGISFQESGKKLDYSEVGAGLHIEARVHLALVHGHVFVTAVLLPAALIGLMFLARGAGATALSRRVTLCLTRGFLPAAAAVSGLMLYKGYHYLLSVRFGATDLAAVDDALFGGIRALRYGINGAAHGALGLFLCIFLWALWRSLGKRDALG